MANDMSRMEPVVAGNLRSAATPPQVPVPMVRLGMRTVLENIGAFAGAISASSLLVSILYNWQYFRIVRADLFQLLTIEDYFATAVQVVSAIAAAAVFVGVFSGLGAMAGTLVSALLIYFGGDFGRRLGARIGDRIGGTDASKEKGGEFFEKIFRIAVAALILIACIYYSFPHIISTIIGLYAFILDHGTFYEIGSFLALAFGLVLFFARNYYLPDVPGSVKILVIGYVVLMAGANFRAIQNAKSDLERTQPSFRLNYDGSVREAVIMRSLEHVLLLRLVGSNEIVFIEWQTFEKGWFDQTH